MNQVHNYLNYKSPTSSVIMLTKKLLQIMITNSYFNSFVNWLKSANYDRPVFPDHDHTLFNWDCCGAHSEWRVYFSQYIIFFPLHLPRGYPSRFVSLLFGYNQWVFLAHSQLQLSFGKDFLDQKRFLKTWNDVSSIK